MGRKKLRIGDALIKEGLINEDQLRKALMLQKKTGKRLGEILIEMGAVTEKDIVMVLAKQLNVPFVNLKNYMVEPEVAKLIPENVAKQYKVVPLNKVGNKLTVAMADPLNVIAIDDIQHLTGLVVKPVIALPSEIEAAIESIYGGSKADEIMEEIGDVGGTPEEAAGSLEDAEFGENDAPIIRLVNLILTQAVQEKVSDIHIEAFEHEVRVRYRKDGVLHVVMKPPKKAYNAIVSRIKIMSKLDIAEKRLPQDGRIKIKVAGRPVDLRVSTLPCVWGEKVVMRILDQSNLKLDLKDLGFEPESLERFVEAIQSPNGIVLVTGPTGSGKTTTLYSAMHLLNKPEVNIMTAEDPVEYQLYGINQVQCKPEIGLTFAAALRSFLRQDPDIIMVGEIRDFETADIAIKASLTGHLVLSTLHTNDAPSTVGRLLNMGIEPFMLATSLRLVQAQRLVRTICKHCKTEYRPKPELLKSLGITPELLVRLGLGHMNIKNIVFYKGRGCDKCGGTGYKGRIGVYEVMKVTETISDMITTAKTTAEIREQAKKEGMLTLRESAIRKLLLGLTTVEEVVRVTAGH